MDKILITGANGLLGQALVNFFSGSKKILATGIEKQPYFKSSKVEYKILDITDSRSCYLIVSIFKPDIIINTAAFTHVDNCELQKKICWQVNVKGVENLAKIARKYQIFLVSYSTDFIFDGKKGPYCEDDKSNPVGYYGKCKLASEKVMVEIGGEFSILRTCVLYGTGNHVKHNFFLWVFDNLKKGNSIQVVTDQFNNPTLVEDLAQGTALAVEQEAKGIYHIAGGNYLNRYDFACEIAEKFDFNKEKILPIQTSQLKQTAVRPPLGGLRIELAEKKLKYNPRSLTDAIAYLKTKMEGNGS
jgi:dTDP-4-dehydrorhamnose reductase